MERAYKYTKKALGINQWWNRAEAIEWFSNINRKEDRFLKCDICDFYPSITEDLLMAVINLAQNYCHISAQEINVIRKAQKPIL